MSTTQLQNVGGRVLANRGGVSRKLLARKAREGRLAALPGAAVESAFPSDEPASQLAGATSTAKRGLRRQLSQPRLQLGAVQPNPHTVLATIVALVAGRSEINRAELLDVMSDSIFPHRAARPKDRGWCQGYVSGAIRGGFLAVVADGTAEVHGEPSADAAREA